MKTPSFMKPIWRFLLLLLLFVGCTTKKRQLQPTDFIPSNVTAVIKVNNLEGLKADLTNSDLLNSVSSMSVYKSIDDQLQFLNQLRTNEQLLICLHRDSDDQLQSIVITKDIEGLFPTASLSDIQTSIQKQEPFNIHKTEVNGTLIYNSSVDSVFIASSSVNALENALTEPNDNSSVNAILNTANDEKTISILTDHTDPYGIEFLFLNDSIAQNSLSNYTLLDIDLDQNAVIMNGITKSTDTTNKLIDVFKHTIPQENKMADIAPSNADGFLSLSFDDYSVFQDNLNRFNQLETPLPETALFDNIVENLKKQTTSH